MASVNRYTKIAPARYTPRTLQEMMITPGYKRQQHDTLDEQLSATETALAQVDPLDVHSERAKAEQQKLYDQLSKQAEQLGSEGFTPTSKSDFSRLNKQYQQAISPTGDLGKIQEAKKAMATKQSEYIANATKLGYPSDAIAANWEDEKLKYAKQFEETGEITNIKDRYSPAFHDPKAELMNLFSKAGVQSGDLSTLTSSIVTKDPRGQYILTKGAKNKYSSNIKNLKAAVDYMNNQVLNPESDVHRSLLEQRKDPTSVLQELEGLNKIFEKNTTGRSTSSQITGFKAAEGNALTNSGMGLTLASEQFAPTKHQGWAYSEIVEKIEELSDREGLDPTQKQELAELGKFKEDLDKKLSTNKKYQTLNNKVSNDMADIEAIINNTYDYTSDPVAKQLRESGMSEQVMADYRSQLLRDKQTALANTKEQIDEFIKPELENHIIQSSSYMITPHNSKQEGLVRTMNSNIDQLFRANPENIKSLVNIESMTLDGDSYSGITPDDKDGIGKLLYNSKPGAIKIINITPKGYSGKPEYTLRIETDKNNSYDMDGLGKGDIGGGKPVELRVSFNNTGNQIVNNVNGYVEQFIGSTSAQGKELAESMEINRVKSEYVGRKWEDISDSAITNNNTLSTILVEALKEEGINSESTIEDIKQARMRIQNKTVR